MNRAETETICRAIASMAPAQKFEDETPAFWAVALKDVRYEDAREAVITIVQRQLFVAVADIRAEVKRIRLARLESVDTIAPNVDPDNVLAWQAELRAMRAAAADGTLDVEALRMAPE